MKILIGLVLVVLLCSFVSATDYYVDATGGDDGNTGTSPANAWKTIEKARTMMDSYNPGDSILFKRGEVWAGANEDLPSDQFRITSSGSEAGGYITFGAYGTGSIPEFKDIMIRIYASGIKYVKIEYLKVNGSPSGTNNGINVQSENASNIIIQHCEVTATSNNGIFFQHTNNFTVDSCTVWNIPNSGIVVYGSQTYQASNGVIRNNTIFNVESNDGITLHRDSSGYNVGSNHFLENNVGSNCAEQAFDITAGNNITIVNCEGYGNGDSSIVVGHEASNVWIDRFYSHDEIRMGIIVGSSSNVKLTNSIIYNSGYHQLTFGDSMGTARPCTNFEAYNNVIVYGPDSTGSIIDIASGAQDVIFRNNIIYSTHYDDPGRFVRYLLGATPENTASDFSHNIWWKPDTGTSGDNRLWYDGTNLHRFDWWQTLYPTEMFIDTLFVDSDNGDFRLQEGSPAIDAGVDVGLVYDFEGNPRFQGDAHDIGAFEFDSGGIPPPPPPEPVPGDLNDDGVVDVNDILTP